VRPWNSRGHRQGTLKPEPNGSTATLHGGWRARTGLEVRLSKKDLLPGDERAQGYRFFVHCPTAGTKLGRATTDELRRPRPIPACNHGGMLLAGAMLAREPAFDKPSEFHCRRVGPRRTSCNARGPIHHQRPDLLPALEINGETIPASGRRMRLSRTLFFFGNPTCKPGCPASLHWIPWRPAIEGEVQDRWVVHSTALRLCCIGPQTTADQFTLDRVMGHDYDSALAQIRARGCHCVSRA